MYLRELFNSTTFADKILSSTLIVLSLSGIFFIKEALPRGQTLEIAVDDQPAYVLPIGKDRIVSVEGAEGKTVVEIKNHRVRVTESPCHNKLCIKQGWIKSGVIVCLPNRVVVTIGKYKNDFDTIVDAITG